MKLTMEINTKGGNFVSWMSSVNVFVLATYKFLKPQFPDRDKKKHKGRLWKTGRTISHISHDIWVLESVRSSGIKELQLTACLKLKVRTETQC